jgi:hypothetical protein
MKPKPGMIARKQDGGACWRRWYRTRKAHLLALSGELPETLCLDQLNLTVCCRYADSLLLNSRINRYLAKHHPSRLRELEAIIVAFENICTTCEQK